MKKIVKICPVYAEITHTADRLHYLTTLVNFCSGAVLIAQTAIYASFTFLHLTYFRVMWLCKGDHTK